MLLCYNLLNLLLTLEADDELFFEVGLTDERRLALFPDETIVRDPRHRESPTCREKLWYY